MPDVTRYERGVPVVYVDNGDGTYSLKVATTGSSGGGTEYTEGATDATITGTAVLWEDTSDTLRPVSAAKPLPVSVASVPSHAVTNAGTFAVQQSLAGTGTVTSVNDSSTSVQLLASNANRRGFRMTNDSTMGCYVKFGTTATSTDYTVFLPPAGYLEEPTYTGRVDGIWTADASGAMRITELS
jgi:hypothetical protein